MCGWTGKTMSKAEVGDAMNRVAVATIALDIVVQKRLEFLRAKILVRINEYNRLSSSDKWVLRTEARLQVERDQSDTEADIAMSKLTTN